MALVTEDGTGVEDANGLTTVLFADAYFTDRSNAAWTGDDAAKEVAIIKATDFMELMYSHRYKGTISADATTLSFPRDSFYGPNGIQIDFTANGIPTQIQKACCEYALLSMSVVLIPTPEVGASDIVSKKEKVGPIEQEIEYLVGGSSSVPSYPVPDRMMRNWLSTFGGVIR